MARPRKDPSEKCRNAVNLNLPDDLNDALREAAHQSKTSVGAYVREVLVRDLKQETAP